ncbi:septation protein A [Pseudorhodoferax sp. Leaf267]|uniref:septation protein A n=1 Tax=Pseudorhodoferax sp. Leaf267 TaxID=1736316 RepID=UPI0006F349D6|nr:septation protein A [Pseudorhodoferax sp. Leaf267]KQP14912.1 septation protein A [Pseudorhodoferax sp. Leaf267]
MKILLDFFPILLFFGAYKLSDIYTATAVLMGATVLQMGITYALERKLQTMHKVTLALVLVFGALTLALHDDRFIKWKPTVLYAAMAIGLAFTVWVLRKNFLKMMLGSQLELPDAIWMRLNWAWIVYCLLMSAVNAYVALFYSTEQWVNFKLWGYVFPLAFIVGQGIYVSRHLPSDDKLAEVKAEEPNP